MVRNRFHSSAAAWRRHLIGLIIGGGVAQFGVPPIFLTLTTSRQPFRRPEAFGRAVRGRCRRQSLTLPAFTG
jgi:hypothetical protein